MRENKSYALRIKSYDISIRDLCEMVESNELDLYPSFKGDFKWKLVEKSKYVESALLQLPLKNFTFEEDHAGRFVIVDGAERIKSLLDFINDKYALKNLSVLVGLEQMFFSDLPYSEKARISRAVLSSDIISRDNEPVIKCEYLKRINISNLKFLPQQARNFAFPKVHSLIINIRENLKYYFEFKTIENSWGTRLSMSKVRTEQFCLCLILIQEIYNFRKSVIETIHLGNSLDELCNDIEKNRIHVNVPFIFDNLQATITFFELEDTNLVYRNFTIAGKGSKKDLSMNDLLCRIFEVSHGIDSNRVKFNFFNESSKIPKLLDYI